MYRIYTEDVNRPLIENILRTHLSGYTLFSAIGFWRSDAGREYIENSLCIETIDIPDETLQSIASDIKTRNHQESVLIVHIANTAQFI